MTPHKARQQAFQYEKDNPQASPHQAYMQGFIFAQQYYDINEDDIIFTPSCHCASPTPPPTDVVPPPTDVVLGGSPSESFDQAWQLYQRKDNKQSALKAWNRLTPPERIRALSHIPAFVQAHPDKQYRPMLATYLNQKRFNDEEIITNTQPNEQQQRFAAYADAIQGLNSRS